MTVALGGVVAALGDPVLPGGHTPSSESHIRFVVGLVGADEGRRSRVTTVACGAASCVALRADGTVVEWDGKGITPVVVKSTFVGLLRKVTAVASGQFHKLALRADGTVVGWGDNRRGALGDGRLSSVRPPCPYPGFPR